MFPLTKTSLHALMGETSTGADERWGRVGCPNANNANERFDV
jgi:hypothetical protein